MHPEEIRKIIESSELYHMAKSHLDEETFEQMIEELVNDLHAASPPCP